jgi:ribosomal protein L40E
MGAFAAICFVGYVIYKFNGGGSGPATKCSRCGSRDVEPHHNYHDDETVKCRKCGHRW